MKKSRQMIFVLSLFLLIGVFKLYAYKDVVISYKQPPKLLGLYCTEVGGVNLRLKSMPSAKKEFMLQGAAGSISVKIEERVIQNELYLQAPPLNYMKHFDNYYSKVRPLTYRKNGVVRAFRYHDMMFDQIDCGENNG
jgi:hypothetical protein